MDEQNSCNQPEAIKIVFLVENRGIHPRNNKFLSPIEKKDSTKSTYSMKK